MNFEKIAIFWKNRKISLKVFMAKIYERTSNLQSKINFVKFCYDKPFSSYRNLKTTFESFFLSVLTFFLKSPNRYIQLCRRHQIDRTNRSQVTVFRIFMLHFSIGPSQKWGQKFFITEKILSLFKNSKKKSVSWKKNIMT